MSATVKPVKDWYEFYGSFGAKISGRAGQLQRLKISHKLDFGLKVFRFEDLVEFLSHTPYSAPAPIRAVFDLPPNMEKIDVFKASVVCTIEPMLSTNQFRVEIARRKDIPKRMVVEKAMNYATKDILYSSQRP